MRLRVLTNSEQKAHRRCSREHHIAYELGIRSAQPDADPLRFGTLIHTALEAWWKAKPADRLTAALATLPLDGDPFELARATQMLIGYDVRWADAPFETIATEVEFRAPLINPASGKRSRTFELGGKIDALALNTADGRIYIVEHKTSSDTLTPGSDYWRALQIDTQVSTYYVGARALGYDVAGCVYDVLGKPALRPRPATAPDKLKLTRDGRPYAGQRDADETPDAYGARIREAIALAPDRYFVRGTVVRLEDEQLDAQWDTWQTARAIADDAHTKRFPRNPDACRRFGRLCSYFDVCTGSAELEDPERFRKVERLHEELSEPIDAVAIEAPARLTH